LAHLHNTAAPAGNDAGRGAKVSQVPVASPDGLLVSDSVFIGPAVAARLALLQRILLDIGGGEGFVEPTSLHFGGGGGDDDEVVGGEAKGLKRREAGARLDFNPYRPITDFFGEVYSLL
jgi:hypothetical protein